MEKSKLTSEKELLNKICNNSNNTNDSNNTNSANNSNNANNINNTNNTNSANSTNVANNKIDMHSPAQLAYAGDAVYELLVRSYVLNNYDISVNKMHILTVKFVKAKAQAYIISKLTDVLTEEEMKIVKRGRNTKVTSSPKNVDFMDYRYATGFEALFGYLFLNNEIDRLLYIFDKIIGIIKEKDDDGCE